MLESESLVATAIVEAEFEPAQHKRVVIWEFESEDASEAFRMRADFVACLRKRTGTFVDLLAARVIFSELVGNVVLHAPGSISITVAIYGSSVIIRVDDTGPGFVFAPSLPRNPYSEKGRGLFLISHFAAGVWVERRADDGTSVLAALPLNRAL